MGNTICLWCYKLNCAPPNLCWSPNSPCDCVGHFKLNDGIKVESQLSRTGTLLCEEEETPACDLVVPWSQTSSLQNCEKMFLLFKPLSLWCFMMAAWLTNAKVQIINILGLCARTNITRLILECLSKRLTVGWEINHKQDPIMQNSRCSWQCKQ